MLGNDQNNLNRLFSLLFFPWKLVLLLCGFYFCVYMCVSPWRWGKQLWRFWWKRIELGSVFISALVYILKSVRKQSTGWCQYIMSLQKMSSTVTPAGSSFLPSQNEMDSLMKDHFSYTFLNARLLLDLIFSGKSPRVEIQGSQWEKFSKMGYHGMMKE